MLALIFDTETTGLPLWREPSDHPDQPHIVDLACELWDGDTLVENLDLIVKPGVPIPPELSALHGITDEIAAAEGVEKETAVEAFHALVQRADLIVGHNVSFDVRMMRIETARVRGEKWDNPKPIFCTMRKSTNHCRILGEKARHPEDWKWPKLGEAIRHFFDEDFTEAHRARPDCEASRRIFFHLRGLEG
jgi:DNA polymerase III subunit epsilon